jgi:peptidoglycan/xylan/chitin deacetylase (PgdA/CDA1 family)
VQELGTGRTRTKAIAAPFVSRKVAAELAGLFVGAARKQELPDEPVKPGYCNIKYVNGGVPFLVQSDKFLKRGEVILTFDDGPGEVSGEFAEAMAAAGAPSTFFVLGSKLGRAGRAAISSAAAAGHEIAVHGYWHATQSGKPFTYMTTEEILAQIKSVVGTIEKNTDKKPALFRPPYGIITAEALRALDAQLGLTPVGWTVDTLDWSTKNPEELFQKTISMIQKRGKGIVLMHDVHPQSREAALRLAAWLKDNGYKILTPERLTRAYRS